jgi:hypothetical protein
MVYIGEMKNTHKILFTQSQEKRSCHIPGLGWENIIKTDLTEARCDGVECIKLAQGRVQ